VVERGRVDALGVENGNGPARPQGRAVCVLARQRQKVGRRQLCVIWRKLDERNNKERKKQEEDGKSKRGLAM